jgi:hypothetical protein
MAKQKRQVMVNKNTTKKTTDWSHEDH